MKVAESCAGCGSVRPSWLGERHVCPQNFTRLTMQGGVRATVSEPHTAEEYELGYLATGRVYFDFPRDWS